MVVRRFAARGLTCALITLVAGGARADGTPPTAVQTQAPWLTPWLPPPPPDLDPVFASGFETSIEVGTGTALSAFTTAPALSETAECGWYLASSTKQALGVEAIEKLQIAIDHVTPELGMLGAALRRAGRRNIGSRRMIDFERLHAGLAVATRGSNLDAGLGAGLAFGFATFAGTGFDVSLDSYFFAPSDLGGPEKLFMLTVGFVYSPQPGTHAAPPLAVAPASERPEPTAEPCKDLAAYQAALVAERKVAVEICNQGASSQCDVHKAAVLSLSAKAEACYHGEDVGPPPGAP